MYQEKEVIPVSVKFFSYILICAGLFFAYVYIFNPSLAFPGTNIDTYAAQFGFASAGVRVLGSVIALILSVLLNSPRFLFITLVSRIFIELGDIFIGVIIGGSAMNTVGLLVLVGVEIWATLKLFKIISH